MSVAACAELVRRGDPDRFLSAMTGTPDQRARLFPLYAFNLEIARVPYMSAEPLVAQMRLQFWSDAIDEIAAGDVPGTHEVAQALAGVVHAAALPPALLRAMVDARVLQAEGAAGDARAFVRGASGSLMQLAGRSLGAGDAAQEALGDLGAAQGMANWLVALPALARAGRGFQMPGALEVAAMAAEGLESLARARSAGTLRDARLAPALRAAWQAKPVLAAAVRKPEKALSGGLDGSPFMRRGRLALLSLTGRW